MKKYLLITIFSFFLFKSNLHSQFAPDGAIWYYNVQSIFPPHENSFGTCQSAGDTIINSIACKKIIQQNMNCMEGGDYVYESAGIVYRYNDTIQDFTVLYNFNAIAGGGWYIISSFYNDSTFVSIDSTSLININGQWKKILYGGTFDAGRPCDFFGPFVEGIGSLMTLYPTLGACDGGLGGLRCYDDTIIGLYDTHRAPSCDSVYIIDGVGEISGEERFTISPNPASSAFTIKNIPSNGKYSLQIVNILGEIIYSECPIDKSEYIVDTNLAPGIYFVRLNDGVKKLLIN